MFYLTASFGSFLYDNAVLILIGAISAILGSKIVEPVILTILDGIKNSTGHVGKIYNFYSKTLGRFLFLKKRKIHKALGNSIYEYRIYNDNGKCKCYESKVERLDQNYFYRIQGEMLRSYGRRKSYFKGYIKNNFSYIIWEERYKDGDYFHNLTTYYSIPKDWRKELVGMTLEEFNGQIVNSISILTKKQSGYSTVNNLLTHVDVNHCLDCINLKLEDISPENNQIL